MGGLSMTKDSMDIEKATVMAKRYFTKIHDNLGLLGFKVEEVKKNGSNDVWWVDCSFYPTIGSSERSYYRVRININTGIIDVKEKDIAKKQ